MLHLEDPPLMIVQWRQLAALYLKAGNVQGFERTTRLADQLEQMLIADTVTYSGGKGVVQRYCLRCFGTFALSQFPREIGGRDGFARVCKKCIAKALPPKPVNKRPRKKKEPEQP